MAARSRCVDTRAGNLDSDQGKQSCGKADGHGKVVHASLDKLGVPGRWLRHKLLDGILVGTPVVVTIQNYRTPLRTAVMKAISFLGTEDFYTVLFLLLYWTLDSRLGRLFGVLMGIGFYVTGYLKNLICLPRPPSPPVVPEEKAHDWALPSHHSLLGTVLPWYIWLYVNMHHDLSLRLLIVIFATIVLWSFSVLFSRLYLGVHSPADIVAGGFVGVIVLSLWLQVDDLVDDFISQQKIEKPLQCVLLFVAMLYVHPRSDPANPSFTDNCCLSGVVTGLIFGRSQRSRLLGFPSTLETSPDISLLTFVYVATLRMMAGAVVVFGLRAVLKSFIKTSVKIVYRFFGVTYFSSSEYRKSGQPPSKHYTADFLLPPIHSKISPGGEEDEEVCGDPCFDPQGVAQTGVGSPAYAPVCGRYKQLHWDIDAPVKCILYSLLTYAAVEIIPRFFIFLGI